MGDHSVRDEFERNVSIKDIDSYGTKAAYAKDVDGYEHPIALKTSEGTSHQWGGISMQGISWLKDVRDQKRPDGAQTLAKYWSGITSSSDEKYIVPLQGSLPELTEKLKSHDIDLPKIKTGLFQNLKDMLRKPSDHNNDQKLDI